MLKLSPKEPQRIAKAPKRLPKTPQKHPKEHFESVLGPPKPLIPLERGIKIQIWF